MAQKIKAAPEEVTPEEVAPEEVAPEEIAQQPIEQAWAEIQQQILLLAQFAEDTLRRVERGERLTNGGHLRKTHFALKNLAHTVKTNQPREVRGPVTEFLGTMPVESPAVGKPGTEEVVPDGETARNVLAQG